MSTAVIVATIPSTRTDGSVLLATAIASITFQKLPAGAPAGTLPTVLKTNSEPAGSGLAPSDLTYSDTSANVGDSYTAYVTDTAGNVGATSAPYVAAVSVSPPPLAAPSAPTIAGTFTP